LVAHYIASSIWIWALLCTACLLGFLSSRVFPNKFHPFKRAQNYLKVPVSILLLCLALGGLRTALAQPAFTRNDLAWYNDRGSYTLVALIDQPPDRREAATYLHVSARELYDPESMTYRRISGTALVRVSGDSSWQLGDLLRFTASP
jgi:hypothetical protein